MKIHINLLILFLCGFYYSLNGQEINDNLAFRHLTSKDGLSQRSVLDILQDSKGYLWFATRDGLNKYDGNTFVTYRHNSEDSTSISHSWVKRIYEDSFGNIWVGTLDGLNKYNPEKDNFIRYISSSSELSTSKDNVWDIVQLDGSFLWVATNNGILKIDILKNKASYFVNQIEAFNYLNSNQARSLFVTSNNNLWITTTNSITVFRPIDNSIEKYQYPKGITRNYNIKNAPVIFEDSHNNIWLGYENGLALFNTSTKTFNDFSFTKGRSIKSPVRTICEDNSGNLWIGTYTGIYISNLAEDKLHYITHDKNNPKSLSQNSIYKIIQDKRGDMWIGTWGGGVNYFDKSYDVFKNLYAGNEKRMLNYGIVSSIVEDESRNLWIGTEGGGLNLYDLETKEIKYFTYDTSKKKSITSNNIKSIIKDDNGNLWIGTHDGGLNFLNTNEKPLKFEPINATDSKSRSLSDFQILSLFQDRNNNIWIGTIEEGLFFYNTFSKNLSKVGDITNTVQCIVKSPDPDFLIIGGSSGIAKVNIHSMEFKRMEFNDIHKLNTPVRNVNTIYIDDNNDYWIGTEGNGLFYYNVKNKKSIKYGTGQGLPNEVIYGVLKDDNNNLWISTNTGISQFNLKTKEFKNYSESDGLQGNEFNYGAYTKTSSNELIFGGVNGITYFNPNKINKNTFIPTVDIQKLDVNNQPYAIITDSISKVILNYYQNNFSIDFIALSFSQPNKNQYSYKLEGYDSDWRNVGNSKTATYTNIDAGDYTFKVKASNNDGVENEIGASLAIVVKPAFWKTWWAYVVYGIISMAFLLYTRTLVMARVEAKKLLEQEKSDKEKLEDLNKLKLEFFTNISHEFRTPLTLILGPLQRLIESKKGDVEVHEQLQLMSRNANTLLQLINQLLSFSKREAGELKLRASENNIIPFVENIALSFNELAKRRNIKYTFNWGQKNLQVWFDEAELKKVIINILSNAFKFTPNNGEIIIEVLEENADINKNKSNTVKILIQDSGIGIPKEKIKYIFDRYYQIVASRNKRFGTGLGLALVKDITELHRGKVKVESDEGKGVLFIIELPLGNEHLKAEEMISEEIVSETEQFDYYEEINLPIKSPVNHTDNLISETKFNHSLPSILLVEDNEDVRMFIKNIFIKRFNVFEAVNGEMGIEIAESKPVDIIISDIMMPVMDGVQLCHNLKSNIKTSHIPIILLTAKASIKSRRKGYKKGADVYIAKPFDAQVLDLQVNNLLNFRRNTILKFKKDTLLTPEELTVIPLDEQFLEKAFKIVNDNMLNAEFNAQYFTRLMGVSQTLLYKKLKALTGQSISEFIRSVRLKKAAQLISQSKLNISEIAYDVGFNDLKYFRNNFKVMFNVSPSDYRKTNEIFQEGV